jgi:hypothetical protein
MPTLSDYRNVYGEAVKVLREKGYQVWRTEPSQMYCAEKDGWDFMADSPTALLGVIAIFEHKRPEKYREYWWSTESFLLADSLPATPQAYDSVMVRDRKP